MTKLLPTQPGDVLVLATDQSYLLHAVALVVSPGEQDVHRSSDVKYVRERAAALAMAKTLVQPGRRIFLRNIDTDEWSEIPA